MNKKLQAKFTLHGKKQIGLDSGKVVPVDVIIDSFDNKGCIKIEIKWHEKYSQFISINPYAAGCEVVLPDSMSVAFEDEDDKSPFNWNKVSNSELLSLQKASKELETIKEAFDILKRENMGVSE
jgi:hypothetical protein